MHGGFHTQTEKHTKESRQIHKVCLVVVVVVVVVVLVVVVVVVGNYSGFNGASRDRCTKQDGAPQKHLKDGRRFRVLGCIGFRV